MKARARRRMSAEGTVEGLQTREKPLKGRNKVEGVVLGNKARVGAVLVISPGRMRGDAHTSPGSQPHLTADQTVLWNEAVKPEVPVKIWSLGIWGQRWGPRYGRSGKLANPISIPEHEFPFRHVGAL